MTNILVEERKTGVLLVGVTNYWESIDTNITQTSSCSRKKTGYMWDDIARQDFLLDIVHLKRQTFNSTRKF